MTMKRDYIEYIRKCHNGKIYGDKINIPPTPLFNMLSSKLYSIWELNVISSVNPEACNEHRFILVTVNYIIKWVKTSFYARVT